MKLEPNHSAIEAIDNSNRRRSVLVILLWMIYVILNIGLIANAVMQFNHFIYDRSLQLEQETDRIKHQARVSEVAFTQLQRIFGLSRADTINDINQAKKLQQTPSGTLFLLARHKTFNNHIFIRNNSPLKQDTLLDLIERSENTRRITIVNHSWAKSLTWGFNITPDGSFVSFIQDQSPLGQYMENDRANKPEWLANIMSDYLQQLNLYLASLPEKTAKIKVKTGFWLPNSFYDQIIQEESIIFIIGLYNKNKLLAYHISIAPAHLFKVSTPKTCCGKFTIAIPAQTYSDLLLAGRKLTYQNSSFDTHGIYLSEKISPTPLVLHLSISWGELWQYLRWRIMALIALSIIITVLLRLVFVRIDIKLIRPELERSLQLIEAQNFSNAIIHFAPVALCVYSPQWQRITIKNRLADQLLQGIDEQYIASMLIEAWQQSRPDAALDEQEISLPLLNGGEVQLMRSTLRTQLNQQPLLLCALLDLTETNNAHKRVEAALIAAKELSDQASAAKSNFLAAMSHEIRTPLHGTLATIELLSHTSLDPQQREYVQTIQSSGKSMLAVINDVLDYSKIEAEQLTLQHITFDPAEVAEQMLRNFQAAAQQKNLALYALIAPDMPALLIGDPARIGQIIANLLSNAIKFTHSGHIVLNLRGRELAGRQYKLQIQVIDSGEGIAAADLSGLFDPFVQAAAGKKPNAGGTGLGLVIVDRLTRAMQGYTTVESQLGQGTCFSAKILLRLPEHAPLSPRLPPEHVCACYAMSAEGQQVLDAAILRCGGSPVPWQPGQALDSASLWLGYVEDYQRPPLAAPANLPVIWVAPNAPLQPQPGASGQQVVSAFSRHGLMRAILASASIHIEPQATPVNQPDALPVLNLPTLPKVLLVEDHPVNRQVIARQLQKLGCQVISAASAEEVLATGWQADTDLMITDAYMTGMDGYMLISQLRAVGIVAPMIVLTAGVANEVERLAQACGANGYLLKPADLAGLKQAIESACQSTGAQ